MINNQNKTNIAILLCLFTGLRVGELCGLKCEDIDFDSAILCVKRTVQRISKNGKSQVIIGTPKSKTSVRTVPIPAFVLDILRSYRSCGDFYIITGKGKSAEPRTMQNRFKSILKLCGIRNVNFHLLRHTYATICIEKDFDPKTLSELLGHADAAITLNRYCPPPMQIKKDYVSTMQDSVLEKNQHLDSRKENKSEHGWGLKSVKEIAEKHEGIIDIYEKNGMFKPRRASRSSRAKLLNIRSISISRSGDSLLLEKTLVRQLQRLLWKLSKRQDIGWECS